MHLNMVQSPAFLRTAGMILLALSLACQQVVFREPCQAHTPKSINFTCGVKEIGVEIVIGGGADGKVGGLRLFNGDIQRASDFESALFSKIAANLQNLGVNVVASAPDTLLVAIFGHPVDVSFCQSADVYMVEVLLDKESLSLDNDDTAPTIGFRAGVSLKTDLEDQLIDSILSILDETWCQVDV